MNVKYSIIMPVSVYIIFSYTLYHSPEQSILLSDKAHFVLRLSPFQGAIWCISSPEMGYFASRNGAFCNTKKHPLNRSHWYSIYYKSLSYFAYLRPMRVLSANTRLFFGVESKTNREKSKYGYNLKPGHIVSFHHQETTPIRKKINLTTVHLLSFHPNKTTLILDLRQCFFVGHNFICISVKAGIQDAK